MENPKNELDSLILDMRRQRDKIDENLRALERARLLCSQKECEPTPIIPHSAASKRPYKKKKLEVDTSKLSAAAKAIIGMIPIHAVMVYAELHGGRIMPKEAAKDFLDSQVIRGTKEKAIKHLILMLKDLKDDFQLQTTPHGGDPVWELKGGKK